MPEAVEVYSGEATIEVVAPVIRVVEVITEGPRGPVGEIADIDQVLEYVDVVVQDYFVLHPQSFEYDQTEPVFHWEIVHPLDHRPAVVVTDSSGTVWLGEVNYPASNRVTIDFNVAISGRATLT